MKYYGTVSDSFLGSPFVEGPVDLSSSAASDHSSCWSCCCGSSVLSPGKECGVKAIAAITESLERLASAIRATAPVEVQPGLYGSVMAVPGFTEEQLVVAFACLVENRAWGTTFMAMPEPRRVLWIKQILAKEQL